MAVQELIRGMPPSFQAQLDAMADEARRQYLLEMTRAERKEQRQHEKMRKAWMHDFGEDIGPFDSLYDIYWRIEEEQRVKQSGAYTVLGLTPTTDLTKRDVKNAYRRKARKLHPDVGGDDESFKQLHAAYRAILANTKS